MNDSTKRTQNLAPGYERRLIEAGMPAQGTEARAIARAIARWDAESIPFNAIECRLCSVYRKFIEQAGLGREETGAIAA